VDGESDDGEVCLHRAGGKVSFCTLPFTLNIAFMYSNLFLRRDVSRKSYPEARSYMAERGMLPGTTVSDKLDAKIKEHALKHGKAYVESLVRFITVRNTQYIYFLNDCTLLSVYIFLS
jgi:hypothetical protein